MSDPHWPTTFPSATPTFGNLHTGDNKDDDARIIDADVLEVDKPPTPIVEPIRPVPLVTPVPLTRLLTSTQACDPQWGTTPGLTKAVLLLPGDGNRKALTLRVQSPTAVATDYVRIADDPGKLENANAGAPLYHGDNVDLDDHTGPVWVTANGASAIVNITAIATTF